MLKKLSLAISVSLVLYGSSAYAAAFDCSKANGYVELTICTTPALSSLDDHLNALYKQVNQAKPENAQLVRKAQLLWLKEVRNKATTAQMIQQAYQSRINDLNMMVNDQQS
ncbi:TPA: DUF1311 domain-containing protein, partial [Enterobacter kobei]|nr:DUF1311 domain-containing protein [Enterobacter kobei]